MPRILATLIAPLLPAIIPLILLAACATSPTQEADRACEAAEKGDIPAATQAADKAFEQIDNLPVEGLCRLAASYAVIALTTGDQQAADRFQTAYKASLAADSAAADKFYRKLDPQMADGLAIISGLLDGNAIYTTGQDTDSLPRSTAEEQAADIPEEAIAED